MDPAAARLPGIVPRVVVAGWAAIVEGHLSGRAPNTRAAYRADLDCWSGWCDAAGIDPLGAQRADVQAYVDHLRDRGRAPATIKRQLTALRGAYRWGVAENVLERNPAEFVRGPKVDDDSQALGLDAGELDRFLQAAAASSPCEGALFTLLASNALRISEACALDVAALTTVRSQRILRSVAKGGKRREHPLNTVVATTIEAYLAGRRSGPMFLHPRTGRRIDRHWARRRTTALAQAAGLPPGVTPHSMRHSFVTIALDRGANLVDVQDAAGHADPRTTRRYDRARNRLARHPTFLLDQPSLLVADPPA